MKIHHAHLLGARKKIAAADVAEFVDAQFTGIVIQIGHVSPPVFVEGEHPLMHSRRSGMKSRSLVT